MSAEWETDNAVGQSYIGDIVQGNDDWNNAPDNDNVWQGKKRDQNNNYSSRNNDNRPSRGRGYNNTSFRSGKSFNSNRDRGSYRENGNHDDDQSDNGSYIKKRDFNRGDGNYKDSSNDKFTSENAKELYIPPEPSNDESEIFGTGVSAGINFMNYSQIPVKVSGGNIPPSINSFDTSNLRDFLLENVTKSGYTIPTPIQKHAIPIIMAQRDLMACAQTGSGKTAAFLLPIINELLETNSPLSIGKPQVLIVSPTRELSIQIFNEARKFSIRSYLKTCIVYGGTATIHQSDNISKGCHILVATPGRLIDFVDKGYISFENIRFIVLDEADRMLDMGFLPAIEKIMNHPTMISQDQRQTLMFSATFPEEIQKLAGYFLHDYIFLAIGIIGGACSDVEQNFYAVKKFEKRKKLMEVLDEINAKGTMVFVETKRNADFLASLLSETKYPTTSIHGDRLQREREEALRDFKSGQMHVLIATSVAARGLDIKNVSHVINYDLPKSIDEYVHRIGRTGRVGNRGKAISFYDEGQDVELRADLVKILEQAEQPIPNFLKSSCGVSSNYTAQQFGGQDVRNEHNNSVRMIEAQEPEEEWQ